MRWAAILLVLASAPGEAEVPIAIAPTGHATVPVEGQFGVRQFVFDTGAEGSAVYAGFADEAKLPLAGKEMLQGQTGASETPLVQVAFLSVDGSRKDNLEALRLDPRADGAVERAGQHARLGRADILLDPWLRRKIVRFDAVAVDHAQMAQPHAR
jgi:hypothetical protein